MGKNKTLLIMAAGMGSRFGGLKQIEPVGPNDEFLIDYSVYDAIYAGFNKIVFIIKEENYEVFRKTIGKRVEPHIEVAYVFQNNDNIPYKEYIPADRIKPLGTAHAILCAKDELHEPFAVINADDFYGRDAYLVAADYLESIKDDYYAVVSYQVSNTLSPNGSAKRGVCIGSKGKLESIIESSVERVDGKIIATPLNGMESFEISDNTKVSMNLLLFTPTLFPYLEEKLEEFMQNNKDDLTSCEFLIPDVLEMAMKEKRAIVELLETTAKWTGVTYKEDKDLVVETIQNFVDEGIYQQELWKSSY